MVKVEVDKRAMAAFEHNMKQLIALTKKPQQDILRQQGRLFAIAAAKHTSRFGDKPGTGKAHKKDVENSIRRVYKPAKWAIGLIAKEFGQKASIRFKGHIRRRNTAKAQEMVDKANLSKYFKGREVKVISWDGGGAHTRAMKKRGASKVHIVFEAPQINRYIAHKKKRVGEAKSGWAKAAQMLGSGTGNPTRGIPAWAKSKLHKTRGYGKARGTGSKAEVTVAHYGKYGFSKTSMSGLFRHRTNMMAKDIEQQLKAAHRRLGDFKRKTFKKGKLTTK